jgi:hypothetical protein
MQHGNSAGCLNDWREYLSHRKLQKLRSRPQASFVVVGRAVDGAGGRVGVTERALYSDGVSRGSSRATTAARKSRDRTMGDDCGLKGEMRAGRSESRRRTGTDEAC